MKKMKGIRMMIQLVVITAIMMIVSMVLINLFVIVSTQKQTVNIDQIVQTDFEHENIPILVLGAGVINNEIPSKILALRLDKAIHIYQNYENKSLIMSGDHQDIYYNEVGVMKNYAIEHGVDSNQIYLDHAGYSTYDSLYRFKHVFHQDKVIIVTQGYHLSRALMVAKGLGIEAIGVPADETSSTRWEREKREFFARIKDFAVTYLKYPLPEPEKNYKIDLQLPGDLTNNKNALE